MGCLSPKESASTSIASLRHSESTFSKVEASICALCFRGRIQHGFRLLYFRAAQLVAPRAWLIQLHVCRSPRAYRCGYCSVSWIQMVRFSHASELSCRVDSLLRGLRNECPHHSLRTAHSGSNPAPHALSP